jgi:putative transposase
MSLRELDSNKHSVFLLFYHLILVVKYSKKVIDGRISAKLKEMFIEIGEKYIEIGEKYGISLLEWKVEEDHIHCLLKAKPTTVLAKFIKAYNSVSSRIIKKEFPEIRKELWKEYFWFRSYCLLTRGGISVEVIKDYIRKQGNEKSL